LYTTSRGILQNKPNRAFNQYDAGFVRLLCVFVILYSLKLAIDVMLMPVHSKLATVRQHLQIQWFKHNPKLAPITVHLFLNLCTGSILMNVFPRLHLTSTMYLISLFNLFTLLAPLDHQHCCLKISDRSFHISTNVISSSL